MKNQGNKIKGSSFYIKSSGGIILLKRIKGYRNYFVSDKGRVYSGCKSGKLVQKTLFLEPNSLYLKVYLSKNGAKKGYFVHNLVGNTFKNRTHEEKIFDHLDNNTLNNNKDNLITKKITSPRVTKENIFKFKAEILLSEMVSGMNKDEANELLNDYREFRKGRTYRSCYNYLILYRKSKNN